MKSTFSFTLDPIVLDSFPSSFIEPSTLNSEQDLETDLLPLEKDEIKFLRSSGAFVLNNTSLLKIGEIALPLVYNSKVRLVICTQCMVALNSKNFERHIECSHKNLDIMQEDVELIANLNVVSNFGELVDPIEGIF